MLHIFFNFSTFSLVQKYKIHCFIKKQKIKQKKKQEFTNCIFFSFPQK